jgi:hypothetical protein
MATARRATMMATARRVTTTTDDNDGDGDGDNTMGSGATEYDDDDDDDDDDNDDDGDRRRRRRRATTTTKSMMIATARRAPITICGAQAAAHRRWRGVHGAFRRAGGRTGAVHLITLVMAPARREAEAVQRDAARQPAGVNKEEGSRMDACGGCPTKCDTRRRHATTGDATTSRQTRGK